MDPTQLPAAPPASNYTRPDDPSQYIRTYAKDVALLTNTPVPAVPQPVASSAPQPVERSAGSDASTTIHEEGVTMTDFDSSPVNRSGDAASLKEFKQEVVDLLAEDSDGIFAGKGGAAPTPAPAASPLMPQSAIGVAPSVAPSWQPSGDASLPIDPERDAVLARLCAKVEASRVAEPPPTPAYVPEPVPVVVAREPIPEPVEEFVPPAPEPLLRTAAPDFASMRAPVVPSPKSTFALPDLTERATPTFQTPAGPSPLHTYSGDFADRIDDQSSSRFSVLAAQSDAGQSPRASVQPRKRNLVPLFVGSAMLVIGLGAVTGAYVFLGNAPSVPTLSTVPSIITYDETVPLEGSGSELLQALSNASQGAAVKGNVVVTYVTGQDASSTNAIAQPGGVLFRRLSLPAPDILVRNIDDRSTVGYVQAGSESRPFFILRVNSYERTFAGMLAWERTLPNDLSLLYPAYSSSQASGDSSTLLVLPTSPVFIDAVVANHDVRILRDSSGRSLMLYGYVTKDTLIIARDEAAFTALAGRLSNVEK